MSMLSNSNILILIIMSILFLSVHGHREKKQGDALCPNLISVLCVKNVLLDISNAADEINIIANKIEQYILDHEPNSEALKTYIDDKTKYIKSNLLRSDYHDRFMSIQNNINKTDFINLIQEEHNAFSYLYNSIHNILKIRNIFGTSVDDSFKTILNNLQKNILCKYRSILHVYSDSWSRIDEINGIEILRMRKRHAPSFFHNAYSMIVVELLQEWIKNVNNIVVNIDSKYLR
ncbi:unnamed protein product [Rotaria sp. Silwood2]|nr:unnamed protein product [Rotaria sp. Silwood2]CAF4114314.1 unnamed protein product [Rotaria sp. Silwood2]